MHKGQVILIKTIRDHVVTFDMGGTEHRYLLDPFKFAHVAHDPPKAGDVLSAVSDSTPGDSTLVLAPCGCQALLRPN